jgi:hypothetical protein
MEISYNRGADLMTCLAAVKAGSTDCEQALVAEVDNFTDLGVLKDAVFPFDGAGSDDHNRASTRALATFCRNATGAPYAPALFDSLPILGKDSSLANVQPDSPAGGKAQLKTANRAAGPPTTGQIILLGNSLAGYVEGKIGRRWPSSCRSPRTKPRWSRRCNKPSRGTTTPGVVGHPMAADDLEHLRVRDRPAGRSGRQSEFGRRREVPYAMPFTTVHAMNRLLEA